MHLFVTLVSMRQTDKSRRNCGLIIVKIGVLCETDQPNCIMVRDEFCQQTAGPQGFGRVRNDSDTRCRATRSRANLRVAAYGLCKRSFNLQKRRLARRIHLSHICTGQPSGSPYFALTGWDVFRERKKRRRVETRSEEYPCRTIVGQGCETTICETASGEILKGRSSQTCPVSTVECSQLPDRFSRERYLESK
ncbi:hypothetical protein PAXRUDRAFT_720035 [Paxillus rubicundulus Ve08.2h10]|uniref:Uncharacterized protein n=1 Tax=Paxillus rubicundulus Ve08.2h10 TaxID=930991 RepID=A0A0D0E827_9AGAM|nr:hypothetical protein PAXRUDRAFT_720035 [Paxillus rubicundulus Ve08.2h10]